MKHPEEKNLFPSDPNFPSDSSLIYITGRPKSGKSYFLCNMLEKIYKNNFDQIFVMSPTLVDLELSIPEGNKRDCLDIGYLNEKVKDYISQKIFKTKMKMKAGAPSTDDVFDKIKPMHFAICFDDLCADIKKMEHKQLGKDFYRLCCNRRHVFDVETKDKEGAVKKKHLCQNTIIITSQHYKLLPLKYRTSINCFVLFPQNRVNLEAFCREHLSVVPFKFIELCEKVFETKYKYILVCDGKIIKPSEEEIEKLLGITYKQLVTKDSKKGKTYS